MVNVLTASAASLGVTVSKSTELQNRVSQRLQSTYQEKTAENDQAHQEKSDYLDFKMEQWSTVKGGIFIAESAVNNGKESISRIRQAIYELGAGISKSSTDADGGQKRYDAGWQSLVDSADSYGRSYNLVGRVDPTTWEPNTVTYKEDLNGTMVDLPGTFAGSDFKITTADGNVWRPDDGFVLQEFDSSGNKGEGYGSMSNAITLTSYDDTTGEVTFELNHGDSVETISGTLEKGGLGVMPSWFYEGLGTADGQAAARADMRSALSKLAIHEGIMVGHEQKVKQSTRKADEAMQELASEKSDATREHLEKNIQTQIEMQQQMQQITMNISGHESQQNSYAQVFGSTLRSSKLFSVDT